MLKLPNTIFEKRITTGNLLTTATVIVAWAISGAIWYTQVSAHIHDTQVHQSIEEKQRMMATEVHMIVDPANGETNRRLDVIEQRLSENTKVLYEIKGRLPERR